MLETFTKMPCCCSTHSILVVGEGNFSFAQDLCSYDTANSIYVTSFDAEETIRNDEFTKSNVKHLHQLENVRVIHGVDATRIAAYFPMVKFCTIIFNFPHVGGKSNIQKCRLLLEQFFISAASHLCSEGNIFVSLCKGQGGTPVDASRVSYGNTWKASSQAAKAGLYLCDVLPFDASTLVTYREAGYRGVIRKGFLTDGSLVHVFKKGKPVAVTSDSVLMLQERCSQMDKLDYLRMVFLHSVSRFVGKENVIFDRVGQLLLSSTKQIYDDLQITATYLNTDSLSRELSFMPTVIIKKNDLFILCNDVLSMLATIAKSNASYQLSYYSFDASAAISPFTHCISNETVFVTSVDHIRDYENLKDSLVLALQRSLFKNVHLDVIECKCGVLTTSSCVCLAGSSPQCPQLMNVEKGENYNVNDVPNFIEDIPLSFAASHEPEITISHQDDSRSILYEIMQVKDYKITDFEKKYFHRTSSNLVQFSTAPSRTILAIDRMCILHINLINVEPDLRLLVCTFNINAILLTIYGVNDLRLLWSGDAIFTNDILRYMRSEETLGTIKPKEGGYKTRIKYPLCHRHDLCFWLDEEHDEELLLATIRLLCHDYIHSVRLLKVLRHEESERICYCYRMIYSRLDGPLHHLQAVEVQNVIRIFLIKQEFCLR